MFAIMAFDDFDTFQISIYAKFKVPDNIIKKVSKYNRQSMAADGYEY